MLLNYISLYPKKAVKPDISANIIRSFIAGLNCLTGRGDQSTEIIFNCCTQYTIIEGNG